MMTTDRIRGLLLEAFVDAFLLEHDWKSASRYPLTGKTRTEMRELLEPEFESWLASSTLIGDDDRVELLAAPTTIAAATNRVLGYCPHGVNLDRDFCSRGCRV